MSDRPNVAIFWDYENCSPPSNSSGLGYSIVNNIRRIARLFGSVTTFKTYIDVSAQSPESESESVQLCSELQSSGVSMMYCSHKGKKDVLDKMILVDMLAFAIDNPPPATIVLITSDRDYAYGLSILRFRRYQVILIVPSSTHTSPALENQASLVIDWGVSVLRNRSDTGGSTQPIKQPCRDLDPSLVAKLLGELQDDDGEAIPHPDSTPSQTTGRLRRVGVCDLLEPSGRRRHPDHSAASPTKPTKLANIVHNPGSEILTVPRVASCSRHTSVSSESTRTCSAIFTSQSSTLDAKAPGGLVSTHNCSASELGSPIIAPGRTLAGSVSTGDDDGNSEWSNSYRTTDTPKFNYRRDFTSSAVYTPSRGTSRSHSDSPSRNAISSPAAGFLRLIDDGSDSDDSSAQHAISSQTSGAVYRSAQESVSLPSSSFHPPPSTSAEAQWLNESEQRPKYTKFKALIDFLISSKHKGDVRPPRSIVGTYLAQSDKEVYRRAGVSKFKAYISLAEQEGVVELGGKDPEAWVALHPNWSRAVDESPSNTGSVPSSDAIPSPSTSTVETQRRDEGDQGQKYTIFKPLIDALRASRDKGDAQPLSSVVGTYLLHTDKEVYRRAGASKFKAYIAMAEREGIVEIGGEPGNTWVSLRPAYY